MAYGVPHCHAHQHPTARFADTRVHPAAMQCSTSSSDQCSNGEYEDRSDDARVSSDGAPTRSGMTSRFEGTGTKRDTCPDWLAWISTFRKRPFDDPVPFVMDQDVIPHDLGDYDDDAQ
jgi:hypothetical protein